MPRKTPNKQYPKYITEISWRALYCAIALRQGRRFTAKHPYDHYKTILVEIDLFTWQVTIDRYTWSPGKKFVRAMATGQAPPYHWSAHSDPYAVKPA